MAKLSTQPYKGTRDFLPQEMSVRVQVFQRMFEAVEKSGFQRYDGPILESAAIYEAKSGEEIANEQLYRLRDKSGRELALRPEMTPSVARIVAGHDREITFPARWYCHVNCHRYERPQRGRAREHWQLNVDVLGSETLDGELEIFDVVGEIMTALGANPEMYVVRVNDRILVEAALLNYVGVPHERLLAVSMAIDRWEKTAPDATVSHLESIGLSPEGIQKLTQLVTMDLEGYCAAAGNEAAARSRIVAILRSGLSRTRLKFDPLIIRALNYYTSTVFEVFDTAPTNARSIFGGGRYDDLASLFTDRRIPGVGFGMGDVTTWNFLDEHGLLPEATLAPDVYVFATHERFRADVRGLVADVRSQTSLRVIASLDYTSMKSGFRFADKSGAGWVVAIDDREHATGDVLLKRMSDSQQWTVSRSEVVARIKQFIGTNA